MNTEQSVYARWAREVLTAYFGRRHPVCHSIPEFSYPAACFVSLHRKDDHSLRGCIGTLVPNQPDLKEEIHTNALSAALSDPRFPPLTAEESTQIYITVDVLDTPEPVQTPDQLDPKIYGVIVSSHNRRGVLLPDLPGIDQVEQQLDIARRKAGIPPEEPLQIQRFRVTRYH